MNKNNYNNSSKLLYSNKFIAQNLLDDTSKDNVSSKDQELSKPLRKKTIINIDSSNRSLTPVNIYGSNNYLLRPNSLLFNNGQSLIKIIQQGHTFKIDDKISISNAASANINLYNIISIKRGSQYVRVEHANHGISLLGLYDNTTTNDLLAIPYVERLTDNQVLQMNGLVTTFPDSKQNYILSNKISINLSVSINGVVGNFTSINRSLTSVNLHNFIFDIPINIINRKQSIYPIIYFNINTGTYIVDPNAYLIALPYKANYNYLDGVTYNYIDTTYTTTSGTQANYLSLTDIEANPVPSTLLVNNNTTFLNLLNIYGIPLSYINADYPLDSTRRKGYQIIKYVGKDYYIIDVGQKAVCNNLNQFLTTSSSINDTDTIFNTGGGSNCTVRLVEQVLDGYPNPYSYSIALSRNYKNVASVRMISSEIPNTYRLVYNATNSDDNANNMLYWQNLEDGDYLYSVSIIPGNYGPNILAQNIVTAMNNTLRLPYITDLENPTNLSGINYDSAGLYIYNLFTVDINVISDVVTFSSYRETLATTLYMPYNKINVVLQSHNLTSSSQFYLIVTSTEPAPLTTYSTGRLYYLDSIASNNSLNMSLNTTVVFISSTISVNTTINYNQLSFSAGTTLLVQVSTGDSLPIGSLIYRALDNALYIITAVNAGYYSLTPSNIKIIVGSQLINITGPATYAFVSFTDTSGINYQMIVYHADHGLAVGSLVIINNSLAINGVSDMVINATHYIASIINDNEYIINLVSINTVSSPTKNNIIRLRYPDLFRLRFDMPSSIGTLLGFRNIGSSNSITVYNSTITNLDMYDNDVNYDSTGVVLLNPRTVLPLSGANYLLLTSRMISNMYNIGPVSNVFAKILLTDVPGTIIYNSFISPDINYDIPIASLSVIDFAFYLPNGNIFDFNGMDHSFTLEITEMINYAEDTYYNSRLNTTTVFGTSSI